tara:strand:- start:2479 stop:4221 length:1743 start_codon:yes stop_codon:yes gene_type:complete
MILKSSNYFLSLLIIFLLVTPLKGEEKIDIWKNKNNKKNSNSEKINKSEQKKENINPAQAIKENQNIIIEGESLTTSNEEKVFGIYDPADFDFNLNMWTSTKAEDVNASIKRIKKIKLSKTSNEILENVLLSFSYPPLGMKDDEFIDLKINWLIENNQLNLIEEFLKQNEDFKSKSKAVQHIVDYYIAEGNIKDGCKKIKFIDGTIKASYLEKFKIYCLAFNKKESEARLLLDLLREQSQSDNFFDDKINFLLGVTDKVSNKINEDNLLNFYLSSVTIKNFKYEPTTKTKKGIWKYLNASNLIILEDVADKEKLKDLELAANKGQVDKNTIFEIYKQIPFDINVLINAKNIYPTLNEVDSRALIYQKYLLSENNQSKVEYLFLLEDLFIKNNLNEIYKRFISDKLEKIGLDNVPDEYKEVAQSRILTDEDTQIGKVKYNDKVLHQSKILKFYLGNENKKKTQKEITKIFKKVIKNKKYFYSGKDLALTDALIKDGFEIPSNFNFKETSKKYEVPSNLLQLTKNDQSAFLALKIVEIIGEDEPHELDPETIYFIINLLNEMNLIKLRNKVLISALPLRTQL